MTIPIADELRCIAKGEILSDSWSREIYSVDASHYAVKPSAVVYPVDKYDIEEICKYCFSKNVPITARGAGTGLLGQSLSNSIVIDFTKYMNKIMEIGNDYIEVQPGVVKGILDKELKKTGKFLPPDPASSNYCTIGGMIANNSSGAHCLGYGSTIDFIQEICVVYSDGATGYVSGNNKSNDCMMANLLRLLSPYVGVIQNRYPKVTKNSCGYRLDAVINRQGFSPQKIFAASEGTLGILTSIRLKILDIPLYRNLLVLGFEDLLSAISEVPLILQFFPVALEMLDHTVVCHGEDNTPQQLTTNPGCLLFVEFAGDRIGDVERKLNHCKEKLSGKCNIIESVTDERSMTQIWEARKGALNRIMKLTYGTRKPIGLIEDTVVKPTILHGYTQYLLQTYLDSKLDYVFYGHVGDGNLHTRPLIDLDSKSEVELIERLAQQVFDRVIRTGGTITGEHGDGIARVKYIPSMYGNKIFSIFLQVKKIFDPKFILNPGKKIA
jgi:glycolate dehydrogenase FAD-linked subunit